MPGQLHTMPLLLLHAKTNMLGIFIILFPRRFGGLELIYIFLGFKLNEKIKF